MRWRLKVTDRGGTDLCVLNNRSYDYQSRRFAGRHLSAHCRDSESREQSASAGVSDGQASSEPYRARWRFPRSPSQAIPGHPGRGFCAACANRTPPPIAQDVHPARGLEIQCSSQVLRGRLRWSAMTRFRFEPARPSMPATASGEVGSGTRETSQHRLHRLGGIP